MANALIFLVLAAVVSNTQAISCLSRSYYSSSSNGSSVNCSSSYSTCYSYTYSYSSTYMYSYGGCGTCSSSTYEDCTTCSTDNCNTLTPSTISCFSRSSSLSTNGTMVDCHSGVSTCYSYTSGSTNYGGCGSCSSSSTSCTSSSMCSTNYCNTVAPAINCYYVYGDYLYGNRQKKTCFTSSCYEYSYGFGSTNFFFAGCGSCYSSSYSNCRTCYTEYCNSASATGVNVKTVAAAAVFLMAMMKLF